MSIPGSIVPLRVEAVPIAIRNLPPGADHFRIALIAMTAERESTLSQAADIALTLPRAREACPHNLAPTTSSLMQLALGEIGQGLPADRQRLIGEVAVAVLLWAALSSGAAAAPPRVPAFEHVVVIVFENKEASSLLGRDVSEAVVVRARFDIAIAASDVAQGPGVEPQRLEPS